MKHYSADKKSNYQAHATFVRILYARGKYAATSASGALYDQARRIFYDERGQLRPLDPKLFGSGHRGPFPDAKSRADAAHAGLARRDKSG
jgi:hypothetical protein